MKTLLTKVRRATTPVLALFSLFFGQTVWAHESSSSVFQTVFGENLSHWLVAHQGFVALAALIVLVLVFKYIKR